ncbi:MAG TPA: response regulator [Polyangia bacterium]|jgi:CheY-like chemotaxis protein|nr:response regulator [Polyangia bacterium]
MIQDTIRFLLVDDSEENLVALEALLRRPGLELLKARSGAQALELLLVNDVALALLDVQMPEMNGFELAELMRGSERTKHVPIIFVTAGAQDSRRLFKGYEAGAVDFLFKPVDPHVLKSKADVFFQLQRQKIDLANNLRLNEMFVGILGHDLRNPLSSFMTGAQLLSRQLAEEKHQRTVGRMLSSAARMRDMIDQMLDLTRARLGGGLGFIRARRRVDVAEIVGRIVDELRLANPERPVHLRADGDCVTAADATRLMQLFSNLVSNAIHHGTPATPVTVAVEGAQGRGAEIVVTVHNEGSIRPEVLPRIFDPFRGERSSIAARGLGLGLFISQQIASAHAGSIAVESTAEAGTTFTVRVPKVELAPRVERVTPRRLLVVDDDDDVRETLREAFEDAGYQARTACDGREALRLLKDGSPAPDAVILDLVMPVLDGQRVYQAMKADPALAEIPVIISTSNPSRAPSGVVVLPKPVRLERILEVLTDVCGEPLAV